MFQDLGPARSQLSRRQGGQQVNVRHHQPGLMEGTDQILATRGVNRRLAADRGIDLGQQGGRDLDEVDATHIERSRQPGQIADNPATEREDQIPPVESEGQQPVDHPLQLGEGFGGLARRHGQQSRPDPGRFKRRQHRGPMQGRDRLVRDDDGPTPGHRRNPTSQLCHQPAADHDIIRLKTVSGDADDRVHPAPPDQ